MRHVTMFRLLTVMMLVATVWALQKGDPAMVTLGGCAVMCYLGVLAERFWGDGMS